MSTSASPDEHSAGIQRLLEQARPARRRCMPRRERVAESIVGLTFLAGAAILAGASAGLAHPGAVAALVALYGVASCVEFDVGSGYGMPTQLALIPLLFAAPAGWVPLLCGAALVAARAVSVIRGDRHPDRLIIGLGDAWHTVGPAIVFAIAVSGPARWGELPMVALALASQFFCDLLVTVAREWLRLGEPPRLSVRLMLDCYVADLCLMPVGLGVAISTPGRPIPAAVMILTLCALLTFFARDRRARMQTAVQLNGAYRGTAMLLGDVVEHDDAYTGSHSRDVLELSMDVGRRMGLDEDALRRLEFAALLHDVGKIAIPNDIINKDGPLTSEERTVINTHTIEGEKMLASVGGLLGEVGLIVRSCHEHYDGQGYPDGLAGAAIPVEARIVACTDAFNAMTTDRSYRRALPLAEALEELRRHRGTQFDPDVVDALLAMHDDQVPFPDDTPVLVGA
jgi:HD-GYP domain-containing protein (c-di-GMP phosphodiesterase class II)